MFQELIEQQLAVTIARITDASACTSERAGDHAARLAAAAAREADIEVAAHHPLFAAVRRLALSPTEQRVLWVLIAHEVSGSARTLLRELGSEQVADVTFDVLRRVVYGPGVELAVWRELGPAGTLRDLGLIERTDGTAPAPEHRQTFKLSRRVLALLHGDIALDPQLRSIAKLGAPRVAIADLAIEALAIAGVRAAFATHDGLVVIEGTLGAGRRTLACAALDEAKQTPLVIDARALSTVPETAAGQLRAIRRECRLLGVVPVIRDLDAIADQLALVEGELDGLVVGTTVRPFTHRWVRPPRVIQLASLGASRRAELWARALPHASAGDANHLANVYPLSPALIVSAGAIARDACADNAMRPKHIEAGVRAVTGDRSGGLATRVAVTQKWNDLVLPAEQAAAMSEIVMRIRERRTVFEAWGFGAKVGRGLGVTALFSGAPGTGKTMAAGLVARAAGLELYRVDLSKIVSKWIGETEQHLAALFDAAEACHAALLFDEADALFGKRTAVTSSNDRHANQEIDFLLQRLETFAGVCLLTTNHETAVDDAFRRRLAAHVRFTLPDRDERAKLWRALIPADAPTSGPLPFDQLADDFAMSGGYIRNAVVRAAFFAASRRVAIDAALLACAAQIEAEAIGKVVQS